MRALIVSFFLLAGILACEQEDSKISQDCTYSATVVDISGTDGCGYVFQLDNGN